MIKLRLQAVLFYGSILALGGALVSQYGFGYHPCEMCLWQRIPYALIILFSLIPRNGKWANKIAPFLLLLVGVELGLAILHTGVEQKWWEGFTSCSTGSVTGTIEELREQIMNSPIIRCDEPALVIFGLSMAAWNVIYSGLLLTAGVYLWQKQRKLKSI